MKAAKPKLKLMRPTANRKKTHDKQFKPGQSRPEGGGRKKGQANRVTTMLRDAILQAAANIGSDGRGKGELIGYLEFLGRKYPPVYERLLEKVLPLQVAVQAPPSKFTPHEAIEKLRERGLPVPPTLMSLAGGTSPVIIEHDYEAELNGEGPMNNEEEDEPLDDDEDAHAT